ncbi:MAG: LacI family transcriptional regulator [Clostridiales bacterium]|jgi:LacI family transcriptional regulator/LacI family asc operon transcriptional repressor|nr:LacI family transcriptional regulator [Clostridiales bacterium]
MNIHGIAEKAGVSVATVSRVINNNPSVSHTTREKILAVMRDEGYTPNAFARGLGLNSMRMVGILCRDVANLFYGQAVSLLERSLRAKGYNTILCCSGLELESKKNCLNLLLQKKVDAIILVGSALIEKTDNSHLHDAAARVPLFLINSYINIANTYCVLCDEAEAMSANVRYMSRSGIKDILYLHDMVDWAWAGTEKLNGIKRGLSENGIPENPELVQAVSHGIEPAKERVSRLIENSVNFGGIIASEDILAVGAQKALLERGLNLPIIGFNNSLIAQCVSPALTSVDNMLQTICPVTVNMLYDTLEGGKAPSKVLVAADLVERETFRRSGA